MEAATVEKVKKAIDSLTGEQYIVMYLNGVQFGAIDEPPSCYNVDKMDDEVVEISFGEARVYLDSFEIRGMGVE